MVQKKAPSKLRIQADHVKSDKHLANLKPSPSQYQDGKNRTAELKKKMKKSRSIKLSDLEGNRSSSTSSFRRNMSQPGKPPPLHVTTSAASSPHMQQSLIRPADGSPQKQQSLIRPVDGSPQKQQPLIRAADDSPNYMKSTSSSIAKKELSLVNIRNTQTGSECNNRWKNKLSNPTLRFVTKPARTLTRSSSLKKVRTLTKIPSFKLTRGHKIKTSAVAMSEDINLQKATCSSTLKDSKFPEYLMLKPGGTECEGTSVVKVCPYNYCSLNGHHHSLLPPLKSFLSAKRRALKTLKSFKLEARSPRRVKVTQDTKKASDIQQNLFDGSPEYNEVDVGFSNILSSTQNDETDYFVQIYIKDHEVEAFTTCSQRDEFEQSDSTRGLHSQYDIDAANGKQVVAVDGEEDMMQVIASVSDDSPKSEIDFEEDFAEQHADVASETEITAGLFNGETTGEDYINTSKVKTSDSFTEAGSQATDMEWEGDLFIIEFSDGGNIPIPNSVGLESKFEYLSGIYDSDDSYDEHTLWTKGMNSIHRKAIMASEAVQEASCEENFRVGTQIDGKDDEIEDLSPKMQIPVIYEAPKSLTFDQLSASEYSFHDLSDLEETRDVMPFTTISMTSSDSGEDTIQEFEEKNYQTPGYEVLVPENPPRHVDGMESDMIEVLHEAFNSEKDRERLEDNGPVTCSNDLISNSSQVLQEFGQVKSDGEYRNEKFKNPEERQGAISDISVEEELQKVIDGDEVEKKEQKGPAESEVCSMDIEYHPEPDAAESAAEVDNSISSDKNKTLVSAKTDSAQELSDILCSWKHVRRGKRPATDGEKLWKFNPREPNFLPLIPDPETEKVDLKHQLMDERRGAEEWMIDYALQQAVTKLAPARKRKVALLVEAFETVIPVPKYESHIQNTSAFTHHRPMQACS